MRRLFILLIVMACASSVAAQSWSTLPVDVLVNMNTSTPGTALTTAILNAGTVSSSCTVGNSGCNYSSAGTGFTVGANQGTCSNLGPVQMNGTGGTLFPAQSQLLNGNNLAHDDGSNGADGPFANFGAGKARVRILWCFSSGLPRQTTGLLSDIMLITNANASQYYDVQLENFCPPSATNVYGVGSENRSGPGSIQHPTCIVVPPAQGSTPTTYFVTMDWDITNGVGVEWVFTSQGTLVGSSYLPAQTPSQAYAQARIFSNEGASNTGTHSYYQNLMWEYSSAVPSGTATVTNGSTTVTWVSGSTFTSGNQWGVAQQGGYFYWGAANSCSNSSGGSIGIACPTVMSPIAYCQSTTVCTLTTAYTGTTGTIAFSVELPLFWTQTDLTAGVVPPSRVGNWNGQAGVQGGIPSALWSQCSTSGSLSPGATAANIQAAVAANSGNSCYVFLTAGTYNIGALCLQGYNKVELRGAGANQTFIVPSGATSGCGFVGAGIALVGTGNNTGGVPNNLTTVSGMLNPGSSTVTLATGFGSVGGFMTLDQLDSTTDLGALLILGTQSSYTGPFVAPGNAGPYSVLGGLNNAFRDAACALTSPATCYNQQQYVTITSCNGVTTIGTSCAGSNVIVGFSPPLSMANWNSVSTPSAWGPSSPSQYVGLADFSLDASSVTGGLCGGQTGISLQNIENGWVKGVAALNTNQSHFHYQQVAHISIINNYFFQTQQQTTCSYGTESWGSGLVDVENNIFHAMPSPIMLNGPSNQSVYAYNFTVNNYLPAAASYNQNGMASHEAGTESILWEGNITNQLNLDSIHGTSNLHTLFRNLIYGLQPACYASGSSYATAVYGTCSSPAQALQLQAYHRFNNVVGNILQNTAATTTYNGSATTTTAGVISSGVYNIDSGSGTLADTNVLSTSMFWGNADNVTGYNAPRFNCSELQQFPANNTVFSSVIVSQFNFGVPCYQNHALPASFYYSSKPAWWPSGKPWPIIGPDITGGNLLLCTGGTQARALVTTATIAACTGAGGTAATAFLGLANSNPAMDCFLGTMNGPPNGVTTGPLSFSESACYSGGSLPQALAPICLPSSETVNPSQPITTTCTDSAPVTCVTINGTTPATNGSGGCANGIQLTAGITFNAPLTFQAISGGTGFTDSPVTSIQYKSDSELPVILTF